MIFVDFWIPAGAGMTEGKTHVVIPARVGIQKKYCYENNPFVLRGAARRGRYGASGGYRSPVFERARHGGLADGAGDR